MAQIETVGRAVFADAPLLRGASARAFDELAHAGRDVRIEAREWLFHAGEPADQLYIVLSGRLQVVAPEDGRVLREVGPGAALGELGLLTRSPRSAGVRALRDSRLLELEAQSFVRLVEGDGGFALSVARELARQLQASGGLERPQTRPSVFTVVGAGSGDAAGFARQLGGALGRWGSVATLDGTGLEPDGFAAALEQVEGRFANVLLLSGGSVGVVLPPAVRPPRRRRTRRAADRDRSGMRAMRARARGCGSRCRRGVAGRDAAPGSSHRGHWWRGRRRSGGAAADAALPRRRVVWRRCARVCPHRRARGARGGRLRPRSDRWVQHVALIRSRKAAAMLQRVFGATRVEETPRSLFTVSADLLSSRVVVHRRGPIIDAVGASMSIPGVAPPVRRAGKLLVDGGVLNNLPVDHMAETDEGPIVAVDVIRRLDLRDDGAPPLPTIAETLARATVLGSVERAERNRTLALVLVAPEVDAIGLRQWSAIHVAVDAGRRAATKTLETGGAEALRAVLDARV